MAATHHERRLWSGPLPAPADLQQYEVLIPGGAERILIMAESEQRHRHGLEDTVILSDTRRATFGLFLGFFLAFGAIAGALYLIIIGKSPEGFFVFVTEVATTLGALWRTLGERRKEREQHR